MGKLLKNISDNDLFDLADLFKVFSDSTRIRILYSLFDEGKNVNTISTELEMTQSAISHQLRYLKETNLISSKRAGQSMIYSLADDHVKTIIKMGLEHLWEK
ncbi:winged helix-turn-helix transcriptional regulator [Anaerococcus sp. AGMB00486]|uniref:Winged helix-turn-helix transcriptional regulator n=2 Tax=Anaerococcus TaxID=165779 RepID=A0ABX2NC95_9FIRM|nr:MULTISPECIES: metalloregulator ArsR/SmtB family transcription factor [Anaerococcus]MDY3006525.1 metalloregulator ArsR/SmtB family transcription factor [Anaerococcus porci]MSS77910.1 winged helix-turn-helix transcriptional regulator [Anaerococcus porci]NVF12337.1 winged helix-turn-helix transcriptional regulator [Anaerococcus faecalis]